jgi:hypothetical protein
LRSARHLVGFDRRRTASPEIARSRDFVEPERRKAYSRDEFFNRIVGAHKSGLNIAWSVTRPRVEADGRLVVMRPAR